MSGKGLQSGNLHFLSALVTQLLIRQDLKWEKSQQKILKGRIQIYEKKVTSALCLALTLVTHYRWYWSILFGAQNSQVWTRGETSLKIHAALDSRKVSACRNCMPCSFHCMHLCDFFLQRLPTRVMINKIKESGKLIFHTVCNRVKFQSPSSWESRFQARQFLMDFSLSGFSCKSELSTGGFIFPSCFLLERPHKLHFWEKGKEFLKGVFIWQIALLFKFPLSRCWTTPKVSSVTAW